MLFLRYAIVENLRYMLSTYDTSEALYFGCRFRPYVENGYMAGGAGYVLSREAVRRFVEEALPDDKKCSHDHGGAEDVLMGECHLYDVIWAATMNGKLINL
jgi:glycoprotein-N-acetylgalactosamine 3-beta-galactosyltransferase